MSVFSVIPIELRLAAPQIFASCASSCRASLNKSFSDRAFVKGALCTYSPDTSPSPKEESLNTQDQSLFIHDSIILAVVMNLSLGQPLPMYFTSFTSFTSQCSSCSVVSHSNAANKTAGTVKFARVKFASSM